MDFAGLLFLLDASAVFPGLITIGVLGLVICRLVWKVSPRQLGLNQVAAMLFAALASTTSPLPGNIGLEIPPQSSITGHVAIGLGALVVAVVLVARQDLPRYGPAVAAGIILAALFILSTGAGNASTAVISTFPGIQVARWVLAGAAVVLVASVAERNLGSATVIAATCLLGVGLAGASLGPWAALVALVSAVVASWALTASDVPRQRFWIAAVFGLIAVAGVVIGTV